MNISRGNREYNRRLYSDKKFRINERYQILTIIAVVLWGMFGLYFVGYHGLDFGIYLLSLVVGVVLAFYFGNKARS